MQMALSNQTVQFLLAALESEEFKQVTCDCDEAQFTETRTLCWNYWWFLYCTWTVCFRLPCFYYTSSLAKHLVVNPSHRTFLLFQITGETNRGAGDQSIDEIFFLLHPSLRPIPPCPSSQVSMRVYEEHRKVSISTDKCTFTMDYIYLLENRWPRNT